MEKSLRNIYFNTLDRLYLNKNKTNIKNVRTQYEKDLMLKENIENVFDNPSKYDVYYDKENLELHIDIMPEDKGLKNHLFNRIDIEY